jgi:hypothetical protein
METVCNMHSTKCDDYFDRTRYKYFPDQGYQVACLYPVWRNAQMFTEVYKAYRNYVLFGDDDLYSRWELVAR